MSKIDHCVTNLLKQTFGQYGKLDNLSIETLCHCKIKYINVFVWKK